MSFNKGKLGVSLLTTSTVAEHELGAREFGRNGEEYVYVKADSTGVDEGDTVSATSAYVVTVGAANAYVFGVAIVDLGANEFGWVQTRGQVVAKVASTPTSGTLLSVLSAAAGDAQDQSVVTLTDSTGLSGTHDDTLAATTVPADATGGDAPTEAEFNAALAVVRVLAQNVSDLAQKVIELVAAGNSGAAAPRGITQSAVADGVATVYLF